ncbi:MAG: efflux RND transporter periplasmic adaptor subunit [Alphaproteobacteria bacterium]
MTIARVPDIGFARRLVLAACAAAAVGLSGAGPATAQGPALVVTDPVVQQEMAQTTPVLGRLVSRQISEIAARVAGPVDEVVVDVGSRVQTGDALVTLNTGRLGLALDLAAADVADHEASLSAARSEQNRAQQDLNRLANLRNSAAFNQASYDTQAMVAAAAEAAVRRAQALLDRANASLEQATLDFGDATITAPFPGVVAERFVAAGDYVSVGQSVLRLVNDRELELEADVPTERLTGLGLGTEVSFTLDDGTRHSAVVRAVVPEENPLTRTRRVRFAPTFGEVVKPLAANQSATVYVPQGPQEMVVTVAKDAVIAGPSGTIVYVVLDGTAQLRPVQLGSAIGDRFQVLAGLAVGDQAVVRGNERLQPGQPVMAAGGPPPGAMPEGGAPGGEGAPAGGDDAPPAEGGPPVEGEPPSDGA